MAAGASLGKKVFAEAVENRLCLSVAALWHIQDEGFPPRKRDILKKNIWGIYFLYI